LLQLIGARHVVLEHFDRRRHRADLVVPVVSENRRGEVVRSKPVHGPGQAQDRATDSKSKASE